jgi:hypothetical protein
MTDLDLAASIIADARHAMSPEKPGPRIEPTKRVLWSEDACRIVREWEDRKRRAADPTPAHVRHHESERSLGSGMRPLLEHFGMDADTYRIADSEVRP